MYILDTNVISELRKGEASHPQVRGWFTGIPSSAIFMSVISFMELDMGVLSMERHDPIQGQKLRHWLDQQVIPHFHDRIIDITLPIVKQCARFHGPDPCSDRDALIAATARVHSMTVVTRNTKDFERTGIPLINPWLHKNL